LLLCAVVLVPTALWISAAMPRPSDGRGSTQTANDEVIPVAQTQPVLPTLTVAAPTAVAPVTEAPNDDAVALPGGQPAPQLVALYQATGPGVVNIQVFVNEGGLAGTSAGSGFVLDEAGHIVTNNHVVAGAQTVLVVFFDGTEAEAEVVGTDPDSDLAVVRVDALPDGAHALPLGDSDGVQVGEWVIAIGNPFGLGSSMSVGIVSAKGRAIESGVTPFSIPEAVQTDAAINPGNSGGPLINLSGQVIGVNAQIATGGESRANSGVGFAIPANAVRLVAPVLIETGRYQWPWLGVRGDDVTLLHQRAGGLDTQLGAYIHAVEPGGPAEGAGVRGSTGSQVVNGVEVPVGGDIVVAIDGAPVNDFNDLLVEIAYRHPGDQVTLTVLRDGQRLDLPAQLQPRPGS
jgi:2-alkenal reductase